MTNMIQTFNEFLEEKYDEIDNDSNNMNEAFEGRRDNWFSNLDVEELIAFGEQYGKYVAYETVVDIQDKLCTQANSLHDELKK